MRKTGGTEQPKNHVIWSKDSIDKARAELIRVGVEISKLKVPTHAINSDECRAEKEGSYCRYHYLGLVQFELINCNHAGIVGLVYNPHESDNRELHAALDIGGIRAMTFEEVEEGNDRGFFGKLRISGEAWATHGDEFRRRFPIVAVELTSLIEFRHYKHQPPYHQFICAGNSVLIEELTTDERRIRALDVERRGDDDRLALMVYQRRWEGVAFLFFPSDWSANPADARPIEDLRRWQQEILRGSYPFGLPPDVIGEPADYPT
jgi:hypothetical protein